MVTQVATNHLSQLDHVNRVNVEQEVFRNAKHAEIAAIMTQFGSQKAEHDSATEALRARDEEVRASMLSRQAEILTAFAKNSAALQRTISVGCMDCKNLQEELRASATDGVGSHAERSDSRTPKTLFDAGGYKFPQMPDLQRASLLNVAPRRAQLQRGTRALEQRHGLPPRASPADG